MRRVERGVSSDMSRAREDVALPGLARRRSRQAQAATSAKQEDLLHEFLQKVLQLGLALDAQGVTKTEVACDQVSVAIERRRCWHAGQVEVGCKRAGRVVQTIEIRCGNVVQESVGLRALAIDVHADDHQALRSAYRARISLSQGKD